MDTDNEGIYVFLFLGAYVIIKKRILVVFMASIIAVLAVACASKDNNQAEHTDLQTTEANEEASEDSRRER